MKETLEKAWRMLLILPLFVASAVSAQAQGTLDINSLGDSVKYYLDGIRVTHQEFIAIEAEDIDELAIRPDKEGDTSIVVTTFHPKEKGTIIYIVNDIEVSKGIREKIKAGDIASSTVKKENGIETHLITTKSGRVLE